MQESIYDRLAAADNINIKSGSSGNSNQAFSIQALTGDYRRIVHKPQGLQLKVLEYADPDQPLALSELERLAGEKEPVFLQGASPRSEAVDGNARFCSLCSYAQCCVLYYILLGSAARESVWIDCQAVSPRIQYVKTSVYFTLLWALSKYLDLTNSWAHEPETCIELLYNLLSHVATACLTSCA